KKRTRSSTYLSNGAPDLDGQQGEERRREEHCEERSDPIEARTRDDGQMDGRGTVEARLTMAKRGGGAWEEGEGGSCVCARGSSTWKCEGGLSLALAPVRLQLGGWSGA